ncbi:MAG: hypothetical protein KGZ41_01465 [Dethiobacter sp.]|nr:hypothetical protein [Dethiobacter sp.]MBS3982448.1 hypothetical protein [Dethiobacter sp.]MCL4463201.1 hypothetical protein [Bacillota bacterium]MCL5994278.1 hypothetical protein [Bacillota bacterium]
MRTQRAGALVRKLVGLALAVGGATILTSFLPGYIWILLLGFGLIWAGWFVFRVERLY